MNWYLAVLKNYVGFSGRARRKEYWYFVLFNIIIVAILTIIDSILRTRILEILYGLAVLIPSIAVAFRRLHDTGRSGWWWLIGFIPIIGTIILIIFFVLDSQPGDNKYGPNPKATVLT
jgi:uncharacterized membrane protein YhaH (DUF805 family)